MLRARSSALPAAASVTGWADFAVPSDCQGDDPSCVGFAWANFVELMVRRYVSRDAIPAGCQIDGRAIWARGREMFWRGRMDGGLWLSQGFEAAADLRIFPAGSGAVRIAPDWRSIGETLLSQPIVMGTATWAAWHEADATNGAIAPRFRRNLENHATLLVERLVQGDGEHGLFQNSWGSDWGWHGLGCLRFDAILRALMRSGFYAANLPERWAGHRGWEKYIIEDPIK